MGRTSDFFIRYLRPAFALLMLGSAVAGYYLYENGIRIDYNVESFLPEGNPVIQDYRAFSEEFPRDDAFIVIVFESDSLFSGTVLSDIRALTEGLEEIPAVDKVLSITNHDILRVSEDDVKLEPAISYFGNDGRRLEVQRSDILADTTAAGHLVSRDGSVAAFYVHMAIEGGGYGERASVIDGAREVTSRYSDRYDFKYSGVPYIRNVYVDSINREMQRYVGLSTLMILFVLLLLFRSVRGVILPVVIVYLGMLWTISILTFSGGAIDVLSSTISAIILVVGVADSVHLMARYNDGISRGLAVGDAVRDMIVRLGSATFLTSLTTAIGFATLATSPIVPMQRFGLFAAVGVLATFFVSIIVLTAALTWMRPSKPSFRGASSILSPFLSRVDLFCAKYWIAILWVSLAFMVLSGLAATQLRVNSYVNDDLGPKTALYRDMVFIQDKLVSPFPLEILIDFGEPDAFHEPSRLRSIRAVQRYLDSEPTVGRTISVVDLLDEVNRTLNPEHAFDGLPDDPDLVAQYLFLLEMVDRDRLESQISPDHSKARLSALVDDAGSASLNPMLARVDSVLKSEFGAGASITKTGTIVLVSTVSTLITDSMLISIALAFVFVSLIMAVIYRSAAFLVISLLPNIFPLVVVAGFMGLAGIDIKPATAVIFSISFGIAVDDTIHFLARLRQELRAGASMSDAIRISLLGTGKAIVLTSVILIGGFAVLTTSDFQSPTYMGGLISLAVLAALGADLVVLPALLHGLTHLSDRFSREN